MQLDIVVGFFVLGALAQILRSDLKLPSGLYQSCVIFLLLAIGLKGGAAISSYPILEVLTHAFAVIVFGACLPFLAYPMLRWIGCWNRTDAASVAAHYGSISIATYAVAVSFLEYRDISYEAYFPLLVALLEVPAIIVGLVLAGRQQKAGSQSSFIQEVFFNKGVFLLLGGIVIGAWAGPQTEKIMPFFGNLFHGMLALFLLEMGRVAAEKLGHLKEHGAFLISFAVVMPLIGGFSGALLGSILDLSVGGIFLMAVLGSSASYIAVPAAMSAALPQANTGLAITASLAVTFPFNILVAIPAYLSLIQHWRI